MDRCRQRRLRRSQVQRAGAHSRIGRQGCSRQVYGETWLSPQGNSTSGSSPVHAAALTYRDLIIAKGTYPFGQKDNVIPPSDGSGTIEAVGKKVTKFTTGDKVLALF